MKLGQKLVLILFFFIVAPMMMFGYYFTQEFYNMMLDHATKTTNASLKQMRENLQERLLTYIQTSNLILTHRELRMFLENPSEDWQEQLEWYRTIVTNEVGRYSVVNPYLRATIYVDNDVLLIDHARIGYADEAIQSTEWYRAVMFDNELFVWQGLVNKSKLAEFREQPFFSFSRPIIVNNKKVGVLLIEIDEMHLYSLISAESHDKDIFIVNPHGEIISSNRRQLLGSPVADMIDTRLFDENPGQSPLHAVIEGRNSLLFAERLNPFSEMSELDWTIYAVVPYSLLLSEAMGKRNLGILVTALLLAWSAGAVLFVAWHVAKRIRLLAQKMHSIRRGQFGETVVIEGKDEISELGHTFNLMSVRLKELVEEVYESQIKRKDLELRRRQSELKALQSQINPHFLFNTLDSIRTGALRHRDAETVEKIELLAKLFHKTMSWSDDVVALSTELAFVSDYIRLQQLRFKEKIRYVLDVEPSVEHVPIPKFIIQPLVENAIIHSIEQSEENCTLRIEVRSEGDVLLIVVGDDGAGFAPGRLESVRRQLEQPPSDREGSRGIGLRNVHERLRYLYGDAFGLQLEHQEPRGAKITLRLPIGRASGGSHVQSRYRR